MIKISSLKFFARTGLEMFRQIDMYFSMNAGSFDSEKKVLITLNLINFEKGCIIFLWSTSSKDVFKANGNKFHNEFCVGAVNHGVVKLTPLLSII